MFSSSEISRRRFIQSASLISAASLLPGLRFAYGSATAPARKPLEEFSYADVVLDSDPHEKQLAETHELLMNLSEDSLLKPFREMVGQPAPGEDLGGWYEFDPHNEDHLFDVGFAPGATFGQWVSALARSYAINRSPETREKVLRLNRLYAKTIGGGFYEKNRFPTYSYDKLVCGLIDSHKYVGDPDAFAIMDGNHEGRTAVFSRSMRWSTIMSGVWTRRIRRGRGMSLIRFRRICFWPISAAQESSIARWEFSIWTICITIRWPRDAATWRAGTLTVT